MPKTTAIRLTSKNIDLISETLNISKKDIENDYMDRVLRSTNPESIYFVKDVLYMGTLMPYLVYGHQGFLDDFASVPPGIEDRFVPVTQVKD